MAIRRGYSYLTVIISTRDKKRVTRKARREQISRSRLLGRIIREALETDEGPAPVPPSNPSSSEA